MNIFQWNVIWIQKFSFKKMHLKIYRLWNGDHIVSVSTLWQSWHYLWCSFACTKSWVSCEIDLFLGRFAGWWGHLPFSGVDVKDVRIMMASSNANFFHVTGPLWGGIHWSPLNSLHKGWPVTRTFDDFSVLRLNKRLSKQSRRRWFETPWRSLWRHCNLRIWVCLVDDT